MTLTLYVVPPADDQIHPDLMDRLRQTLVSIEVPFTIDEADAPRTLRLDISDVSESEADFVIRILQRAGYDLQLEVPEP